MSTYDELFQRIADAREIEWDIRRQTDFCSFGERREENHVDR